MKVLWFSVEPITYCSGNVGKQGRGWIESFAHFFCESKGVNLTIAYLSNKQISPFFYDEKKVVKVVPMFIGNGGICAQLGEIIRGESHDVIIEECIKLIAQENPEIIQVWGTEWCFGLLAEYVKIPIVVHIQGIYSQIWNTSYLPGQSFINDILHNPHRIFKIIKKRYASIQRVMMEQKILRINKYFFGRTEWDRSVVKLFNPNANYYYCSEAIRADFCNCDKRWIYQDSSKLKIVTVGNGATIKGIDVILKTALLILENRNIDFEWQIVGCDSSTLKIYEKITNIKAIKVNVVPMGRKSALELLQILLSCSMYVHTSYSENSPNSVCEAQILGVPIICTDVGGCRSLFSDDYDSRFFIPTNDPFYLASKILELYSDRKKQNEMSEQNYLISHNRHSSERLYNCMLNAYKSIIQDGYSC